MIGVIRKFKTASPAVKASMALLFANLILKGISFCTVFFFSSGHISLNFPTSKKVGDHTVCSDIVIADLFIGKSKICFKGRVGEVYNVGGNNEKQNIEIVKIICKELGKPESLITHVGDRKGHDMRYAIDPTKIHNELGWLPETKFEDGIKKTIQWYLDNREWWETIISGEYQNYYEKMYSNR